MPRDLTAHAHWDDLAVNSRQQLFQIMRELELPYFPSATDEELLTIIRSRFEPKNKELAKKTAEIYRLIRHKKRALHPYMRVRFAALLFVLFLVGFVMSRVNFRRPYCSDDKSFKKCRPCPAGATCVGGKAKCDTGYFLSAVGCRSVQDQNRYWLAQRGAKFVARREGDCVHPKPPLSVDQFVHRFPTVSLAMYEREPDFGVYIVNGTVRSHKQILPFACKIVRTMEAYPNIVGQVTIVLFIVVAHVLGRRAHMRRLEMARELARQAHKILATTDQKIYIYDMKVQLRARFAGIDRIWKYVVRFIEDDSHVLVVGARHQVYWRWVASPTV